MTATHDSEGIRAGRWLARFKRTRLLLAAIAIVFAGLWAGDALAALPALAGFVLIVAAALVGAASAESAPAARRSDERPAPGVGDPLLEAVPARVSRSVVAL